MLSEPMDKEKKNLQNGLKLKFAATATGCKPNIGYQPQYIRGLQYGKITVHNSHGHLKITWDLYVVAPMRNG